MKREKGITLIALVITIIVLLILAGIALNTILGENGLLNSSSIAVEAFNKSQIKEKIELNILGLMAEKKGKVSIDEIINELIQNEITTEDTSDRESGSIITEEGYFVEIVKDINGQWNVIVGEKGKANIRLSCSKDTEKLTNIVKIKINGRLLKIGIKQLILPDGTVKDYAENTISIEEYYDVSKNGTYIFTLIGNDGQKIEKEIIVDNILEEKIEITLTRNDEGIIGADIVWPQKAEPFEKEFSLDEGVTWNTYEGTIQLNQNLTLMARINDNNRIIKQQKLIAYVTSGTYKFIMEKNINEATIVVAGAGGGSASGTYGTPRSRGGYGGYYKDEISIESGKEYNITVGKGGYRGYYYGHKNSGRAGGASAFENYTASGGGGATTSNVSGKDGATNVPGVYGGKGFSSGDYGSYGQDGWVSVSFEDI